MYQNLTCIALRTVKHSDRHSILSAYSRERGRLSLLVSAGNGREAARRRAMLMPGSRFSCVADIRDNDRIPPMRDVSVRGTQPGLSHPVKSAVTLFLVDFLNSILRDSMPDEVMFDFIDMMLENYGNKQKGLANFHLLFLIKLAHFAGIEPDISTYRSGTLFDLMDGVFRTSAPLHGRFLERDESSAVVQLMRMNLRNMAIFRLSSAQRNRILDGILEYYSLHFANVQSIKSIEVLRDLFR